MSAPLRHKPEQHGKAESPMITQAETGLSKRRLFAREQHAGVGISVIVPVKNEAELLYKTLGALHHQHDDKGLPLPHTVYEVLLLCNNCTDRSFEVAKAYRQKFSLFNLHIAKITLQKEHAHIGTVRRMLMDEAYDRFARAGKPDGIIVSTDGDSEVDPTWIFHILKEIGKGNDVVGGRILPRPVNPAARLYHLQDVSYRYLAARLESIIDPCANDPWPGHFQCYGPSLAVTCEMYHKAGRLPAIPFLEDEEFRKALYRVDARVRRSPDVKVYTSARMSGQVDFGFSIQLQKWADMKLGRQQQQVESLSALIIRLRNKNLVRYCWARIKKHPEEARRLLSKVASSFFIPQKWLWEQCLQAAYFGKLWEDIETQIRQSPWHDQYQPVPITEAITHLRAHLNAYAFSNTSIR